MIAVSAHVRDTLLERIGLSPDRVVVVHSGVDHARFSPPPDGTPRAAVPALPVVPLAPQEPRSPGRGIRASAPETSRAAPRADRRGVPLVRGPGGHRHPRIRVGGAARRALSNGQRDRVPEPVRGVRATVARGDGVWVPRWPPRTPPRSPRSAEARRGSSSPSGPRRSRRRSRTSWETVGRGRAEVWLEPGRFPGNTPPARRTTSMRRSRSSEAGSIAVAGRRLSPEPSSSLGAGAKTEHPRSQPVLQARCRGHRKPPRLSVRSAERRLRRHRGDGTRARSVGARLGRGARPACGCFARDRRSTIVRTSICGPSTTRRIWPTASCARSRSSAPTWC